MKVSLITVTYNADRHLEDCIRSVVSQNYPNIEYIVVDGKSTDNTVSIIKNNVSNIDSWVSERDLGMYDALNKGMKMATGDIIGILNSDDILASNDAVSQIVAHFKSTKADAVYGDLMYVEPGNPEKVHRIWKGMAYNRNNFQFGWMPGHPTFYVKREVVETLGGYKLKFGTAADYELMVRYMYKHRIKGSYLPSLIVKMRRGGQSNQTLKNRILANRMDLRAMHENHIPMPVFSAFMKPVRKLPQFAMALVKEKAKVKIDFSHLIGKYGNLSTQFMQRAYSFVTFL